jgi:hypothetical protein
VEIRDPYKLSRKAANFGPVSRKSAPRTKKIVITSSDGGPLTPKLRPPTSDKIKAELTEISPGQRYELSISLIPPLESRRFKSELTLETGIAAAPTATIPVIASAAPRVTTTPRRFVVPAMREPDWEQSLRLVWDDDLPHRILGAEVNDEGLSVQVRERDGTQEVVLHAPPGHKTRLSSPEVTIKTDDTETPELKVRVTIARRSARAAAPRATPPSPAARESQDKKAKLRQNKTKSSTSRVIRP